MKLQELQALPTKAFKVITISQNIGSFGHNQMVLVARDGEGWKVQHIQSNGVWVKDQIITVPFDEPGRYLWGVVSVECPERLARCPKNILAQLFQ